MVEIDPNLIITAAISASVIIVSTVISLLYNEKKKREFMKTERLWNLKCEIFEEMLDLIDDMNSTTENEVELSQIVWDEDQKDVAASSLEEVATTFANMYPEFADSWSPQGVRKSMDSMEVTEDSFQRFFSEVLYSNQFLSTSLAMRYLGLRHRIRLHAVNPELETALEQMLTFFLHVPEARIEGDVSKEATENQFYSMFDGIETLMAKELEDTLKG